MVTEEITEKGFWDWWMLVFMLWLCVSGLFFHWLLWRYVQYAPSRHKANSFTTELLYWVGALVLALIRDSFTFWMSLPVVLVVNKLFFYCGCWPFWTQTTLCSTIWLCTDVRLYCALCKFISCVLLEARFASFLSEACAWCVCFRVTVMRYCQMHGPDVCVLGWLSRGTIGLDP